MVSVAGLVLAAGGGSRFGGPKALATTDSGVPWVTQAVGTLHAAGCSRVVVVLGAGAEQAAGLVPAAAHRVVADRWAEGMGASLAAGLGALLPGEAVLITLVDLPGLPVTACLRVLGDEVRATTLRRAVYDGRPGHPVLLGDAHIAPFAASLHGDRGGREYLRAAGADPIECGDLFSGADVDRRQP